MEKVDQFEKRKADHIRWALDPKNDVGFGNGLENIHLIHEALPELNFNEIDISTNTLGQILNAPFLVSSMTAGHGHGTELNLRLAEASSEKNWLMGVGSQRRQLFDEQAREEWKKIRKQVPDVKFLGNIGIAQAIESPTKQIAELADSLQAVGMIIHTNPLQEVMQPEGTPQFKGCFSAIERLCRELKVPVIVKETGCGFSQKTLEQLKNCGVAAVDVAGFGGTHWGRVEGSRSQPQTLSFKSAETFKDWGLSTVESLVNGVQVKPTYQLWASGGIRSGLDAAKLLAMGAHLVGFAKPLMEAALLNTEAIISKMDQYEHELRVALFCTGCRDLSTLKSAAPWKWQGAPQ